jgi:hypothetical protein
MIRSGAVERMRMKKVGSEKFYIEYKYEVVYI